MYLFLNRVMVFAFFGFLYKFGLFLSVVLHIGYDVVLQNEIIRGFCGDFTAFHESPRLGLETVSPPKEKRG